MGSEDLAVGGALRPIVIRQAVPVGGQVVDLGSVAARGPERIEYDAMQGVAAQVVQRIRRA